MSNLYKCSNCGHAIASTARFCTGCRTPGPIARHPNSWRTSEPPEAIAELLAAERGTSNTMPDCGAAPWVWTALGVVVVVGLAVGLWMLSADGMIKITLILASVFWFLGACPSNGHLMLEEWGQV